MKLTDWRGNEYGVGDTVLYARMSGRSCEISEATVVDIWEAYPDYNLRRGWWVRLQEGQQPPEGKRTETRVKVQPNGRGSRNFYRTDYDYVKNAEGDYERVETGIKPVTLNIIANITAVPK